MSSRRNDVKNIDIPDVLRDPTTGRIFKKGKFLGRGGFAKCFELIEQASGKVFAGKVIAKTQLQKPEQREKMTQEINIHRGIHHKHVVEFYSFFEDDDFIYILLEICNKRSMMEMHKRRKNVTEPEVRYFTRQIALACKYLHDNHIVHRDLKLGNLFLNDHMEIKVGDFGLATIISHPGERKMTLCGTPNYIAPEVLTKKGHGYKVDVWSLGCIVYTLLVGRPPFETSELKETYKKIRQNDYTVPSFIPHEAKCFIQKMLRQDPNGRPTMDEILNDQYLNPPNYLPSRLPASCLTTAPRFDQGRLSIMPGVEPLPFSPRKPLTDVNMHKPTSAVKVSQAKVPKEDHHLREVESQLRDFLATCRKVENIPLDEMESDPASTPVFWISKWVDYTEKYGIGYQLCDNSMGVLFNDMTRIVLMPDEENLQYIDRAGEETFLTYNGNQGDAAMTKKITLLRYFKNYMQEHLLKTGDKVKEMDDMARLPYLANWMRTKQAIVFHLTNGIVQINFFADHLKLILCPLMESITIIDANRKFLTYKLDVLSQMGMKKELVQKCNFALTMIEKISNKESTSKCRTK